MTENEETPVLTLDQILADLKGFGIEDTEDAITIKASGKLVTLRLSNIPTEEELDTLIAVEEYKGHAWVSRVKAEILSRAVSFLNGADLRENRDTFVLDPVTKEEVLVRIALRNLIMGWGQEVVNVLWKILMVHCQKIEDRLFESLPDATIMTDVEKRLMHQAFLEIREAEQAAMQTTIQGMIDETTAALKTTEE